MSTKTLEEVPRVRVSAPLRALLLEDSDHDVELVLVELRQAGFEVSPTVVTTKEDFRKAMAEGSFEAERAAALTRELLAFARRQIAAAASD